MGSAWSDLESIWHLAVVTVVHVELAGHCPSLCLVSLLWVSDSRSSWDTLKHRVALLLQSSNRRGCPGQPGSCPHPSRGGTWWLLE